MINETVTIRVKPIYNEDEITVSRDITISLPSSCQEAIERLGPEKLLKLIQSAMRQDAMQIERHKLLKSLGRG